MDGQRTPYKDYVEGFKAGFYRKSRQKVLNFLIVILKGGKPRLFEAGRGSPKLKI